MRNIRIYLSMKFLRYVFIAVLSFAVLFTVFIGKYKINESGVPTAPAEYKGILTLWHIDTFEGGVGSRKQFLLSVSREFEKQNQGVLVMAVEHTAESAEKAMKEGRYPDLISFGAGVDVNNMQPLNARGMPSGIYNGENYATPWCRGGYCVIENPEFNDAKNKNPPLIVSQGEYTNPVIAYVFSYKTDNNFEVLSPMNAYVKFVSGKARYLLGTQRDINRLISRGMDFTITPLSNYNDLYQYVAVTSMDGVKTKYAQDFIEFLVSEKVQKQLNKIGMYSCFFDVDYDSPEMNLMQKTKIENSLSAFSTKELIQELQERGIKALKGDAEEILKIKKLIVSP